jgi:hypothetical protein
MALDELLTDGLACSVLGELSCHRCVTLCDACRPVT